MDDPFELFRQQLTGVFNKIRERGLQFAYICVKKRNFHDKLFIRLARFDEQLGCWKNSYDTSTSTRTYQYGYVLLFPCALFFAPQEFGRLWQVAPAASNVTASFEMPNGEH